MKCRKFSDSTIGDYQYDVYRMMRKLNGGALEVITDTLPVASLPGTEVIACQTFETS